MALMYSGLFLLNSNVEVYLCDEDIWMTQAALADLFQTSRNNITMYIQNIYKEGELREEATSKPDLLVRNGGSRTVKRAIKLEFWVTLFLDCPNYGVLFTKFLDVF